MNIAPPDQIIESGNSASPGNFFDTGYRFKNRDGTAYITVGTGGFTVTGTFTAAGFASGFTVQAGTNLAKNDLVYISSVTAAGVPIVALADADAAQKAAVFVVTDTTITSGNTGTVALSGLSSADLNTNAGNVGDPVYLSTTGTTGNTWTLSQPTASNAISQIVGRINVKSATVGQITFNLFNGPDKIGSNELQSQAVSLAKIARQTDATLLMGKGAGADVAANAMSGDATISTAGALTIGAGAVTEAKISANSLTATVSNNASIPTGAGALTAANCAIPFVMVFDIPDAASGNVDFTSVPFKCQVLRVQYLKTNGAGNAGNYIQMDNGTGGAHITGQLNVVTDTAGISAPGAGTGETLDDGNTTIAAGATIRFATNKAGGNNAARITVTAVRSA